MLPRLLAVLLLALPVAAQTRSETHSPLGLSLAIPRSYAPMPVSPDEPCVQLRYLGKESRAGLQPDLWILAIEATPEPDPLPDPPPLNSLARFLAQRMRPWCIESTAETPLADGGVLREHRLARRLAEDKGLLEADFPWRAVAFERSVGTRHWVVLGFADVETLESEQKAWRTLAQRLKFFEPTAAAEEKKWARFYQFHPEFRNGELRTRLRARLLDGWRWEDTPNFVYLMSSDKAALMRDLQKKLEGIRRYYLERFPPVAEITAVSTVRVCKDRDEYVEYGGPARSAGYWNARAKELVFYENGKEDTRLVLYHEAFHQYVFYAVGEVAPHPWFNEGYGDYFAGAEFNTHGEVVRIHENPWRVEAIRHLLGECPPLAELVAMDQAAFMQRPEVHYPMAWSLVYFLEQTRASNLRPEWRAILPTYYRTLKEAFIAERQALLEPDEAGLEEASRRAREAARVAAFAGVDVPLLEQAWKASVAALEVR